MLRLRAVLSLAVGETFAWGLLHYSFAALAGRGHDVAAGLTVALLASAISAPLVARWIARNGARSTMMIGAVVGVAALLGLAWSPSYAFWVLLGAAQAATLYEPGFVAIASWFDDAEERRRAIVVVTVLGGLASSIFVPIANRLGAFLQWRDVLMVLAGGVGLVVLPLYASLPRAAPIEALPGTRGELTSSHRRTLAPVAVTFAVHSFVSTGAVVYLVEQLTEAGRSIDTAARLAALFGVSQVVGRLLMVKAVGHWSTDARVTGALALQAIALVLVQSSSSATAGVGVAIFGAANGSMTIDRPILIAERVGRDAFARASAWTATVSSFAKAAAPFAVAVATRHFGGNTAFLGLAACLVTAALIFRASFWTNVRLWRRARHGC